MVRIIPNVKELKTRDGFLTKKAICYPKLTCDERVVRALKTLPQATDGAKLEIYVNEHGGEGYELSIEENAIRIEAEGDAGAFYAVQTLRQIFQHEEIPCLFIKDKPDFVYRGFYHDVTRGKIPTVETIKWLIDQMAYYKLNSLQLYVEHTYEFQEYQNVNEKFGYYTSEELKEIDAYCKEHFIDFIPSLSTFGHLYELLEQDEWKHLRVLKEHENPNFWNARMRHHTIDPLQEESIEVIKSLIDQYIPNFESDFFNICCDETFDLQEYAKEGKDEGEIYVDFVKQIAGYVKAQGKKVMMWADILLEHPETLKELPADICYLNWDYSPNPSEDKVRKIAETGGKQILCPGTETWNRLCENVNVEESNIVRMADYAHKYHALGVLNTNWGDFGNPCSLELAMYGLVIGAEKSWSVQTQMDLDFYQRASAVLYQNANGVQYLKELSAMHDHISWVRFANNYFKYRYQESGNYEECLFTDIGHVQTWYKEFMAKLSAEHWEKDEYRQEMLLSAEGICLIAELSLKFFGKETERVTNTEKWLASYKQKWLAKNKASELYRIEEMFRYCEEQ